MKGSSTNHENSKFKQEEKNRKIIEYYNDRVSKYGCSGKSTLLDDNMRVLEIETVVSWLDPSDRVLEVCCGNGVSTVEFTKYCESIVGIDLSEKMIETARQLLNSRKSLPRNISFEIGNILDIPQKYPVGRFNTVISVRGLINLPSWELQQKAILNIHNVLPTGGKCIFIEGSKNGLQSINEFREKFSLTPLKEPWYDNNFETSRLLEFVKKYFDIRASRNLDVYFLISRIFYPLACLPDEPKFDHMCNTVARLIVPYVQADTNTTLLISKLFIKK
jgi:ubiquinone/menaquinone biosynthesis C-methylase UbiE